MNRPTLWLVATPIGNLGDLSPRAAELLATVDLIACEDTRRTRQLLHHIGVEGTRLVVANDHTEFDAAKLVIEHLHTGSDVALVSDAGTPGVSDPGERVVDAVLDAGFEVSAAPGPVAAIMALTISGLPTDRFVIEGFLPRKGRDRDQRLSQLTDEYRTSVLYEAPHRIERTLADLHQRLGDDRRVAVCRELTKRFEEVIRGTLGSIELGQPRGEYVIVIDGRDSTPIEVSDDDIAAALANSLGAGVSKRDAVGEVADRLSVGKNRVYDILHARP